MFISGFSVTTSLPQRDIMPTYVRNPVPARGGGISMKFPETRPRRLRMNAVVRGLVQDAVRALKREVKDLLVVTDVCLCGYTSHGHCGIVLNNEIRNDASVDLIAKTALSHVKAGADMVAPSDMMDGRVVAIRQILEKSGHKNTPILS